MNSSHLVNKLKIFLKGHEDLPPLTSSGHTVK